MDGIADIAPAERYRVLAAAFAEEPGVTLPTDGAQPGNRFGSSALKVDGRIFAMLVRGRLVVKLPRQRVAALIASGAGEDYDPGRGRVMKEWVVLGPAADAEWLPLAREALAFVAARD